MTQNIAYTGEQEFEHVCAAFNDMQASILSEQEKNRSYEKARTDMIAGISHDLRTPLTMAIKLEQTKKGVSICFQDNGVGVPKEKLPYIFDEFYRADESRNKKEGNGLGLYIVKYLMEAMGDSATVMVHINRIREKIEDDSKNPQILETVWGAGYRLNK